MLALFGAAFAAMVLINFLFLRRKAPTNLALPARSTPIDDESSKMLVLRTRYLVHQNSVPAETNLLGSVHVATQLPVSEPAADAILEPVSEPSPTSLNTQISRQLHGDRPDLATKAAVREVPRPTTIIRHRHDPIGQAAMSYAMRHPKPGKRGVRNTELAALAAKLGVKNRSLCDRIYKARLVLRHREETVPLVMNGTLSLWKAYDGALELKRRKNGEPTKEALKKAQGRSITHPLQQEKFAEAA